RKRKQCEKCTSILTSAKRSKNGHLLHAHNEDWVAADREWIYLIRAKPAGEPAFLAFTYGAWGIHYGVNSAGISLTADSQTGLDARLPGLAPEMVGREVLRSVSVKSAIQRVLSIPRVDGHTYVIGSKNGDGVMLETTATTHAILKPKSDEILVHANCFEGKATSQMDPSAHTYSRFRCFRAEELLKDKKLVTEQDLYTVLSDHLNAPESLCHHLEPNSPRYEEATIAAMVFDPAAQTLSIVRGNPCQSRSERFKL
ncbi:MAG: C45 family peptidase, partial [Patescibacteria group bacterium]